MSFLGLFQREIDLAELADEARWVLDGVREGLSDEEAAARAHVGGEDVRKWYRDPAFRRAMRRARQGLDFATVIIPGEPNGRSGHGGLRDATVTVHADGTVEEVSNLTLRTRGSAGPGLDARDWGEYQARTAQGEDHRAVLAEIRDRYRAADPRIFTFERDP